MKIYIEDHEGFVKDLEKHKFVLVKNKEGTNYYLLTPTPYGRIKRWMHKRGMYGWFADLTCKNKKRDWILYFDPQNIKHFYELARVVEIISKYSNVSFDLYIK